MNTPIEKLIPTIWIVFYLNYPPIFRNGKQLAEELMQQANPIHLIPVLSVTCRPSAQKPSGQSTRNLPDAPMAGIGRHSNVVMVVLFGLPILRPAPQPLQCHTPPGLATTANPAVVPNHRAPSIVTDRSFERKGMPTLVTIPNAQWTLQVNYHQPIKAEVYKILNPDKPTVESVRKLANQFGLKGNIIKNIGTARFYFLLVVDGRSQLSVFGYDQSFTYLPDVFRPANEHTKPLSFDKISEKATAYLKERGFLDFPYRVEPGILTQDQVLINHQMSQDSPLLSTDPNNPEFRVSVGSDGSILEVRGKVSHFKSEGEYTLRSSNDAWQALLNGKIGGRFGYQVSQLYTPLADLFWSKEYITGQKLDLLGIPETLQPADGSKPIVMLDNLVLEGKIQEIPAENPPMMRIVGTLTSDIVLNVESMEPSSVLPENTGFTGLLKKEVNGFTITTMDGRTLLLADAPDGLPDNEPASISGQLLPDGRIDWRIISAGPSASSSFSSAHYTDVIAGGAAGSGVVGAVGV